MRTFLQADKLFYETTGTKKTSCVNAQRAPTVKARRRLGRRQAESVLLLSIVTLVSLTSLLVADIPKVEAQTVDWNHVAQVAWRYYQPGAGVNAATGLHYGTLDWHYITDWDTGNYLIAILDAQALGLIGASGACTAGQPLTWAADCRLDKVLHFLETRILRTTDGLPYWAYNSENGQPGTGLGRDQTDAADTGRLLVALYVVRTRMPSLATRVDAILQRQTPTGATLRNVYDNAFVHGKIYGGFYGYYAALGFAQFFSNVQTSQMSQLKAGAHVSVYGQQLPATDVTTEPILNSFLEMPNLVDTDFMDYANRVLQAQKGRWQATGYLTAWSEGAMDVTPYYLYEWIVHTTDETSPALWRLGDARGAPSQSDILLGKVPVVYTKIAFGLHAVFGTDYTQALVNAVLSKVESQYGFREGIREKDSSVIGIPTWPIQDKTNSIVLSAARYALSSGPADATTSISVASTDIFGAPANAVHFIGNTNPYDNQAMLGAWAKTTNPQQIGLWTRTDWVDQTTGQPLASGNLVVVAGPIASKVLSYYASRGLTPGFRFSGGYAQIILGNHVLAQMPESQIGTGTDMFVVHVFRDPADGRLVMAIWGIGAQGTLAAGVWLVSNFSSLESMSDGLCVYQWADINNDSFPQAEEITAAYQGS